MSLSSRTFDLGQRAGSRNTLGEGLVICCLSLASLSRLSLSIACSLALSRAQRAGARAAKREGAEGGLPRVRAECVTKPSALDPIP